MKYIFIIQKIKHNHSKQKTPHKNTGYNWTLGCVSGGEYLKLQVDVRVCA